MCKKIPFLVPRRNKSGRIDGFDELRRKPVYWRIDVVEHLYQGLDQKLTGVEPAKVVPALLG